MDTISVPKTPRSAFNTNRPASKLLLSQVEHLEWAVRPASERKPAQLARSKAVVRTEGEAAARIAELMRQLYPDAAGVPAGPAAVTPGSAGQKGGRRRAGPAEVGRHR